MNGAWPTSSSSQSSTSLWIPSLSLSSLGKNSQISLFSEIIRVLPLFENYTGIYHFLKLEFAKLGFDMELEFKKIEFLKNVLWWHSLIWHFLIKSPLGTRICETRVPCDIKLIVCVSNTFTTFSQLLTYLPSHVTLTKERKKWNPHLPNMQMKNKKQNWKPMRKKKIR